MQSDRNGAGCEIWIHPFVITDKSGPDHSWARSAILASIPLLWVAGTQALASSFPAFPGPSSGSWIRHSIARIPIGTPTWNARVPSRHSMCCPTKAQENICLICNMLYVYLFLYLV